MPWGWWVRFLAALGGGAFVLACLVVGGRLLALALRTRALPETVLGGGLFLMGGFAYPLTAVARAAQALSDETRTALMIGAHVLMIGGIAALAVFNWRVYRPWSEGAKLGCAALVVALLACFAWQGVTPGFEAGALHKQGAGLVAITALAALTMGWSAVESWRWARMLGRQARLGLADVAVALRVRRWAVATSCAGLISAATVGLHVRGLDPALSVPGALVIGPLGLVAAVELWLAFARGVVATGSPAGALSSR
jgi:hypothetical protein